MEAMLQNRLAFQRLRLLPRVLVDISAVNTETRLFGETLSMPVGAAPSAMQGLAFDAAEICTARACARLKVPMGLSSQATTSIEDVASSSPIGMRIFQLYVYKNRAVTLGLVRRAERCGFKAIAVTVDRPVLGKRELDLRNNFQLPSHLTLANFSGNSERGATELARNDNLNAVREQVEDSLDWTFISWLRGHTQIKVIIKGILTTEDAVAAVQHGADAVWISNHGGRQLDCTPASIEVLPEIRRAVDATMKTLPHRQEVALIVDGGVMRGTDVLKVIYRSFRSHTAKVIAHGRPSPWEPTQCSLGDPSYGV